MADPLIKTRKLSKSHRIGPLQVRAIREVTITVAENEFVSIMGPSGSGKSTLINLLGFLDTPSAGQYQFEGIDTKGLDHDKRAAFRNQKIGFIFQNFNLLPRNTALENVELPLIYAGLTKARRRECAVFWLEVVGLKDRLHHWPHQLSGGEQQRVAIARALVNNPVLILADEPTGALDSKTGLEVMAQLQQLNRKGKTIIMVTHNRMIANYSDRIIELNDGKVTREFLSSSQHRIIPGISTVSDETMSPDGRT